MKDKDFDSYEFTLNIEVEEYRKEKMKNKPPYLTKYDNPLYDPEDGD